jgi:hypothetical protein
MDIGAIAWAGMDWVHLTQDKDQKRIILNPAFWFHKCGDILKLLSDRWLLKDDLTLCNWILVVS